jgi:NRPS condensation-like uncharacterized protein
MIPKRKTPKRRVKKVNTIYRAFNRRKLITRFSKSARDIFADNGISENIGRFSDNDKIENKEICLCGPGINKDYIDIINTAISCDLKVTITFMRDIL